MTHDRPFPGAGSPQFRLRKGEMFCEDIPVRDLAERFGTPLHVYSKAEIVGRVRELRAAFGADARICYAVKANPNLAILRLLADEGPGFAAGGGGGPRAVPPAGARADTVVFAGTAKCRAEIEQALDAGIGCFNVESEHELPLIESAARERGTTACVAVRINPDLPVDTHRHTRTGGKDDKFGLDFGAAARVIAAARASRALELVGCHVHLGSQVREVAPYLLAFEDVMSFVDGLVPPPRLSTYDLGGGFGIDSGDGRGRLDVNALAAELAPRIRARGLTPVLEPGRWIVADAGVLLTRVLGTKERPSHRFVLVDAAMTELIRPALYQASHAIAPIRAPERAPDGVWDVVGPVCESGDFLGRSRALPRLVPGELLVVLATGAYGAAMASGYNSRPRAAEVLVDGQDARLVRRRERVEDLWAEELFP